jgi:nucleoside-diphosphate-sugar epimerase
MVTGVNNANRSVVVTGATGFLGSYVVQSLEAQGYQVFAIGRDLRKGIKLNNAQTTFVYLDLTRRDKVLSVFTDIAGGYAIDGVIHCAALSSAWGKSADFKQSNVDATKYLLEASTACNVRKFVFVSSTSVYFDFKDQLNIAEDAPLAQQFANAYAQSKYLAEREVLKFNDKINTVIIRPRGLIGVGDPAIVPRLMKLAARGWFPLIRNGEALVDLTYIRNVADALLRALQVDITSGEIFNISNDEPLKVKDLVTRLFSLSGIQCSLKKVPYSLVMASARAMESKAVLLGSGEPLYTRYSVGLISKSQTLNIDKAKSVLGYQPKYSIEHAIQEYVLHLKGVHVEGLYVEDINA